MGGVKIKKKLLLFPKRSASFLEKKCFFSGFCEKKRSTSGCASNFFASFSLKKKKRSKMGIEIWSLFDPEEEDEDD
jgi:hypothetical protein